MVSAPRVIDCYDRQRAAPRFIDYYDAQHDTLHRLSAYSILYCHQLISTLFKKLNLFV
jgi:hypothetical protein